jgi:hypothetical protein
VDIAQLTRYGSSNFVPNVINNRAMSAYSWAVNTLQSVYGKTRTHRAKVKSNQNCFSSNCFSKLKKKKEKESKTNFCFAIFKSAIRLDF